jgi:hypothetical protein
MDKDPAFGALTKQFNDDGIPFTIEDLLSRVRVLKRVVGKGEARGLNKVALEELEKQLCEKIVAAVQKELPGPDTPYHQFADWLGGVERKAPVEIFTTNYDCLVEQALEEKSLPFFDGFVGARRPFFDLHAIEHDSMPARWSRLWKLHGCASWALGQGGRVTRSWNSANKAEGLLIHPSELKYDQSRRMPYLAMIDRLRAFLKQPSAFLVTAGYAFADEHLNEIVIQELRGNPSAAGFGLLYKALADEKAATALAGRIPMNLSLLARDRGIVRGRNGPFQQASSGAGPTVPALNDLGDFSRLASFLREFVGSRAA